MPSLYMGAEKENIGEYVLFSGDPWRVELVKQYLENPQKVNFWREFNTYTGSYKGLRVTVTSTGIGAPSAAIAMEEMYECGMKVALRMGTVMALDDSMLGQFIVPIGSMRRESTSHTYVEPAYPAVADVELVNILNAAVKSSGRRFQNGITCTMDGFYTQMHDSRFSKERGIDMGKTFAELKSLHVCGIDMETACMLTVGRLMGVKTAALTVVTVLENLKETLQGRARKEAEDLLCRVALDGLYRYATQ